MPKRRVKEQIESAGFLDLLQKDGIEVLSVYEEPFSGRWQVFSLVPLKLCEPTPFQRDISSAHLSHLKHSIEKIGRFLDPIILVRSKEGKYLTPNGNHRLQAMKVLGREKIVAIVIPDEKILCQILALNTEKPHNIKEKSLEVIKMYRHFLQEENSNEILEADFSFEFEEPYFITLGVIYEKREKFSGAAYVPLLKRIDQFLSQPLTEAIRERERRARRIEEEIEPEVLRVIKELEKKGVKLLFIKQFVISHSNPYRRKKVGEFNFDEGVDGLLENLASFDIDRLYSHLAGAKRPTSGDSQSGIS